MPIAQKAALMDRAIGRFRGRQAELLRSAKVHFLEMLGDG
jgi:hypothetical protein